MCSLAAAILRIKPLSHKFKLTMACGLEELEGIWAREVPRLLEVLRGAGLWRTTVLARFFASSPPTLTEVQDFLQEVLHGATDEELDGYVPYVVQAVDAAKNERRRVDYDRALVPVWEIAAEDLKRKRREDAAEYDKLFERQRLAKIHRAPPPSPAGSRVASISREGRELDGDPQAREKGERNLRDKWIQVMINYMAEDGVEDARPRLAAAGRRAATLRTRMLAWRPFRNWLDKCTGSKRARGVDDYIDYMLLRSDEPCSRSTLDGILAMYSFVEGLYGRPKGSRWVDDQRFQAAAKEIRLGLARRLDGNEVRKALRPTWKLLGGLERVVTDETADDFERVLSWFICTSCWCALRFDDHRGWIPSAPVADASGYSWDLVRTKTTGRGKSVELRPVGLAFGAFVAEKNWFEVGMGVHSRMAPGDRDYLLTVPPRGSDRTALARELAYEEYVPRMRVVLAKVQLGEDLVGKTLADTFTAHSWRFFIPSAASALGYSQEHIDSIGTWSIKGGSGYNKTAKERSRRVQEHIARIGREESYKRDVFGETLDQAEVARRLMAKGLDEQDARICAQRLLTEITADEDEQDEEECDSTAAPRIADETAGAPAPSSATAAGTTESRLPSGVTGYVVSVVGRGKRRCLHYLGLCHWVPAVDYLTYVMYGSDIPAAEEYDRVCKKCWPHGAPAEEAPGAETEDEGCVTDNSDSSAE